jgi:hypothetical protein
MPRRATRWLPRRCPRGPAKWDRAAAGMLRPWRNAVGAQASRYGVASSSGRDCSALRGATQSVARGAPRSGDRAATERKRDRARILLGRLQPATGSHLPLEETDPLCGATQSVARGALRSGDRAATGRKRDRARILLGRLQPATGSHLPPEETDPLRGATQSVARGVLRSGDRAAAGTPDRAKVLLGCPLPATGSHLPAEETAPPVGVAPFASSPFAFHPAKPPSRQRRLVQGFLNRPLAASGQTLLSCMQIYSAALAVTCLFYVSSSAAWISSTVAWG